MKFAAMPKKGMGFLLSFWVICLFFPDKGFSGSADPVLSGIEITYPRTGTLFPPEMPPPEFLWKDDSSAVKKWNITIEWEKSGKILKETCKKPEWRPDPEKWEMIKSLSKDSPAKIAVKGFIESDPERFLSGANIEILVSRDPVGAPVFYRDVPLPFIFSVKNPETIRWRMGFVDTETPPVLLENLPVCGNCHSFSNDGKVLGMDVDYASDKGSYAVTPVEKTTVLSRNRVITWSDFRRGDSELTFGLLSRISPDGRYAVSTVKDRSVFVPRDDLAYSQLFFPVKGILAVYDKKTEKIESLPGADDPLYVQSNPEWSPDGGTIYFARAKAVKLAGAEHLKSVLLPKFLAQNYLDGKEQFKYDIYKIPFNDGKGGKAVPVPGASENGMSNYFPKISPDGKWMVFTKAASFMLLQKDSRLHILPADGGTPREMNCNTDNMNSWHSWSPNGKWLVFASKQRGAYTQLYLTHIDENGNDTPPVFLENLTQKGRAANIPEFVNTGAGGMEKISADFIDDDNYIRQGDQLSDFHGEYEKAALHYEKAISINPRNADAHIALGNAMVMTGKFEAAEKSFQEAVKIAPDNPETHAHLARLYLSTYRYAEAEEKYEVILKKWPDHIESLINCGVTSFNLDKPGKAMDLFSKAVELEPENPIAHFYLGKSMASRGMDGEAMNQYDKALTLSEKGLVKDCIHVVNQLLVFPHFQERIEKLMAVLIKDNPRRGEPYLILGKIRLGEGDLEGALRAYESVVNLPGCPSWVKDKIDELKSRQKMEE